MKISPGFLRLKEMLAQQHLRSVWSAIDSAAGPAASLALAAGLVRALGMHQYGLIVVALAFSNLASAINPAIAVTTTKFVSELAHNDAGNKSYVARIMTGSILGVMAISVTLIAIALILNTPLANLIFGPAMVASNPVLGTVLILAVVAICVQQVDAVLAAALRGLEKFKQQAIAEVCSRSMLVFTVVTTGILTHDIRSVFIAYCCSCAISTFVRSMIVRAFTSDHRLFAKPRNADFRRLMNFGGWMWLTALATVAYGTVDRILIGRVVGAGAAAQFSVYVQISQLVHFIPASIFAFSFPVFSRLCSDSHRNRDAILLLLRRNQRTSLMLGGVIAATIFIFSGPLLRAFGGSAFPQTMDLTFLLLIVGFFLLVFHVAPYYYLLGRGDSRLVSLVTSGSMIAEIFLAALLIPIFGQAGAAMARLTYGFGTLTLLAKSRKIVSSS